MAKLLSIATAPRNFSAASGQLTSTSLACAPSVNRRAASNDAVRARFSGMLACTSRSDSPDLRRSARAISSATSISPWGPSPARCSVASTCSVSAASRRTVTT